MPASPGAVLFRIRALVSLLMFGLLALGLVALSFAAQVWWSLPSPQGRLVRGPHDVVGVQAGRSYSWVVPTENPDEVVLVDAGSEPSARRVSAELRKGSRKVVAVLLTHAHGDQTRGLEAFPEVPVYLSADEAPLLAAEVEPGGWMSRLYAAEAMVRSDLRLVGPDETVTIAGETFVAVPTPGHTAGSVTWWWRDVLFTGGALLATSPPAVSPRGLNDDDELALKSVEKLLPLDFDAIADARTGLVTTARPQVHWMLGVDIAPPERSLRGGEPDGPTVIEQRGTYVEAWAPGSDGHRPGLVIDAKGRATVVANPARPEHRRFVGRRVVATGSPPADARIASLQIVEATLELDDDESEGDGRIPHVTDASAFGEQLHRWVVVEGTLTTFQPWSVRARFGEGRLELEGGSVPLTGPADLAAGPLQALVHVVPGNHGPVASVAALCPSVDACRENPVTTGVP